MHLVTYETGLTDYLPMMLALVVEAGSVLGAETWALLPLQPVQPSRGNGFAASIVAALMAIGLLAIVAKFASSKPKSRRRPRPPGEGRR
jgi:hypothetical protein